MEEKKNLRKAILTLVLAFGIILFLSTLGLNLMGRIATFFSSLKKGNQTVKVGSLAPPAPPRFKLLPDATNQKNINLEGSVGVGNTVVVNFNGNEEEILADASGNFTFKVTLLDGKNTYSAFTKDPQGGESQKTQELQIIYDKEEPKIVVNSPSEGATFFGAKQQNLEITGSCEVNSSLTVNERIIAINADGNFKTNYLLNDGENILRFKATDSAGNTSEKEVKVNYSP